MQYPYLDLNLSLNEAREALTRAETQIHTDAQAEDGPWMPENVKIALAAIQVAVEALGGAAEAIAAEVERESEWEAEAEALADAPGRTGERT